MKLEMFLAGSRRMFDQVRLWQPEHAGGVWELPNFATYKLILLLG